MKLFKWLFAYHGATIFLHSCGGDWSHARIGYDSELCPLCESACYIQKLNQENAELSRELMSLTANAVPKRRERTSRPNPVRRYRTLRRRSNPVTRITPAFAALCGLAAGFVAGIFKGEK